MRAEALRRREQGRCRGVWLNESRFRFSLSVGSHEGMFRLVFPRPHHEEPEFVILDLNGKE